MHEETSRKPRVSPTAPVEGILDKMAVVSRSQDGTYQSAFDRPLGSSERCLSANQIVRMLVDGVAGDERQHLLSCRTCLQNGIDAAALSGPSAPDFIDGLLRGTDAGRKPAAVSGGARPQPVFLAIPSREIPIANPWSEDLTVACSLISVPRGHESFKVEPSSWTFEGGLFGDTVRVTKRHEANLEGRPDVVDVMLEGGRLSRRVRARLSAGQRVIDTLRLRSSEEGGFVAQAKIELVLEPSGERRPGGEGR
jgi:hypothetical protein